MFNPPKNVLDVVCADIRVERPNREFAIQRAVRCSQVAALSSEPNAETAKPATRATR
jgi:hypothetical protein